VDRTGALRVALFVFVAYSLARLFRASHVTALTAEIWILIKVLALPAFWGGMIWLLYVALEPHARRRWPQALISWKRLLSGGFRDPLVGRDILIGAAAGGSTAVVFLLTRLAPGWLGWPPLEPQPYLKGATLAGFSDVAFRLFVNQFSSILYAMVFLFMLVLLRLLLRVNVLAVVAWCLLVGSPLMGDHVGVEWIGGLLRAALLFVVLTRGGLLALAVALYVEFNIHESPLTLDLSAWYSVRSVPVFLAVVGLAVYGFHTSLAGKAPFGRLLAED
jgi:serine/threonine-protein kinase